MADIVISIENVSKRYQIGHRAGKGERDTTLRDVIAREACNFFRGTLDAFRGRQIVQGDEVEEFWALKDVSFDVARGEIIGIIGKNGAGKSTLLKILSRITEPTNGRVRLVGRLASLLEVGTGFHPELTGRENIFLNGAILGLTRREIRSRFDEIVAFAGVDKFLDTPVKRYSSGMYVRLAFSVAAHLEPEILVIDEVLAVGDAEFQAKCIGRMQDVATREGRTVLFVSHNMNAVKQLTKRAVVLREGEVDFFGSSNQAIERYLATDHQAGQTSFDVANATRQYPGSGDARILGLRFDRPLPYFEFSEPIRYVVSVRAARAIKTLRVGMTVFASDGAPIGCGFSPEIDGMEPGVEREVAITLPFDRLAPGAYHCGVSIGSGSNQSSFIDYDIVLDTLYFEVGPQRTSNGVLASWAHTWGLIALPDLIIEPCP
jgi:lipopolysaccharide transport system ATP-binding protein